MGCSGSKSKTSVAAPTTAGGAPPQATAAPAAAPAAETTAATADVGVTPNKSSIAEHLLTEGVEEATPAKAYEFINGKPSEMFLYDEITKCTERDNGLLFRLVNFNTNQWAFYNDSKAYDFYVTVVFSDQCSVASLGDTTVLTDPHSGRLLARVVVRPCMTEPFVQGRIDGFDAEYLAVGHSEGYKKEQQRQDRTEKEEQKTGKKGGEEEEKDRLDEAADAQG